MSTSRRCCASLAACCAALSHLSTASCTPPSSLDKSPRSYSLDIQYNNCVNFFRDNLAPNHYLSCEQMKEKLSNLVIFSGSSNPTLAEEVGWETGVELGKANIDRYADGEVGVKLETSVRGKDVYILQSAAPPINETLIETLLIVTAARRASAQTITVVAPSIPYGRSTGNHTSHKEEGAGVFLDSRPGGKDGLGLDDPSSTKSLPEALEALLAASKLGASVEVGADSSVSKRLRAEALSASASAISSRFLSQAAILSMQQRAGEEAHLQGDAVESNSISSADVARMLVTAGVDRLISVEMAPPGSGQIDGFYPSSVPVESLRATRLASAHISKLKLKNPVVVAPNEVCIALAVDMRDDLQRHMPGIEVGLACITGKLG